MRNLIDKLSPAGPKKPRSLPASKLLIVLIGLGVCHPSASRAGDNELNSSLQSLADVVARIRVISENCQVDADPMLEGRIFNKLEAVPNLDISKVMALFLRKHQNEAHASGAECHPGAIEHLATLDSIYRMSVADLEKVVAQISN